MKKKLHSRLRFRLHYLPHPTCQLSTGDQYPADTPQVGWVLETLHPTRKVKGRQGYVHTFSGGFPTIDEAKAEAVAQVRAEYPGRLDHLRLAPSASQRK